jgi:hypothetical protein
MKIPAIILTEIEKKEIKKLWNIHKLKYKQISINNFEFRGYRKSILMILELINKVVHSKPSVRSVLCNKKRYTINLTP